MQIAIVDPILRVRFVMMFISSRAPSRLLNLLCAKAFPLPNWQPGTAERRIVSAKNVDHRDKRAAGAPTGT
jgi:hypothetical protein